MSLRADALRQIDRAVVVGGLALASGLAWSYTLRMSRAPGAADPCAGCFPSLSGSWTGSEWGMAFAMWAVMMAGMMLPTAIPMSLTFADMKRERRSAPFVSVGAFVSGYLTVWTAFSALATLAQWALHRASLLSSVTLATGPALGGGLLMVAGLFQWTPWKDACMVRCRSPLGFFLAHWRAGRTGALVMGVRYGVFCVGCCWALMVLSFATGLMNVVWMAALTVFMLAEKVAPAGRWVSRVGGAGLAAWGGTLLWRALA